MKLRTGSIFDVDADAFVVPTNGVVKNIHKGIPQLVMGKGLALVFRDTFCNSQGYKTDLDYELGEKVHIYGNHSFLIPVQKDIRDKDHVKKNMFDFAPIIQTITVNIISFPTKIHFKDDADLDLIKRSIGELITHADQNHFEVISMPKVATGLGNLNWDIIRPLLESELDDRFVISEMT